MRPPLTKVYIQPTTTKTFSPVFKNWLDVVLGMVDKTRLPVTFSTKNVTIVCQTHVTQYQKHFKLIFKMCVPSQCLNNGQILAGIYSPFQPNFLVVAIIVSTKERCMVSAACHMFHTRLQACDTNYWNTIQVDFTKIFTK